VIEVSHRFTGSDVSEEAIGHLVKAKFIRSPYNHCNAERAKPCRIRNEGAEKSGLAKALRQMPSVKPKELNVMQCATHVSPP
jgi:hypothetical protein